MPTFFRDEPGGHPALDLATQAQHARHLCAAGVTGLVLAGSTGEAIALSPDERTQLIAHVREATSDAGFTDRALIAGTTAQDLPGVLEQLRAAHAAGAGYGLVLAPGFFGGGFGGASQDGLAAWFEAVAEAAAMPILAYSFPAVSNGLVLSSDTLIRLAQHPRIVGCKLSHGDLALHARVARARDVDPGDFAVFTGMASQLVPALSVGCAGAIDGLAAAFPRVVVALCQDVAAADVGREFLREVQHDIALGQEFLGTVGIAGLKRVVADQLGYRTSGVRLPLQDTIDEATWERYNSTMVPIAAREGHLEGTHRRIKREVEA